MEPLEPNALVDAWCAPWGRTGEAAVSAIDVLLLDALENEDRARPEDGLVTFDGAYRLRAGELAHWTLGWPYGPGLLEKLLRSKERAIASRLARDLADAALRADAFRAMRAALGEIPWQAVAPMEVVSLAMGHFGPSRQPAGWDVSTPWLRATAAHVAANAFGRASLAESARRTAAACEAPMREIAAISSAAIAELGRRAGVADPLRRPIRSFLPLLGGTLV